MRASPLVSVIVPVYNVERWLERCVRSICMQTHEALEIILVDDGSADSSGTICDRFAAEDARVKVIHKENGGLSDARNAGMACASGEYVAFVDSDDWIEPGFIAHLAGVMQAECCDAAGCVYRRCAEDETLPPPPEAYAAAAYDRISAMDHLIGNRIEQVVWNKLYKRALIDGIPFEKGKYHEDEYWSYQVFARMNRYVQTDFAGYNYLQRMGSIMGAGYSLKRLDAVEAKARRQAYLNKNMPELAGKGRVNLMFTCMYHGQLALKQLDGESRAKVFAFLQSTIRNHRLLSVDMKAMPVTHRLWMYMSGISLKCTCLIRNMLGVGC